MTLTADQILAVQDLERRTVPCPKWGGDVIVQELSGEDADAFAASMTKTRVNAKGETEVLSDTANIRAKLVARCLVDDDGNRIFKDAQVAALGKKSADTLKMLFDVASEMSGLGAEAEAAAEGESEAVPSDGSSTSSPEN